MIVRVFSHFEGKTWEGEIDLGQFDDRDGWRDEVNETLFRFFNRVTMSDGERLEAIGYRLPSLSVEDRVTWGGSTYEVARVGFVEVTA